MRIALALLCLVGCDDAPEAAPDAGPDSAVDAAVDATVDAAPAVDAAPDVAVDGAVDASPDATLDASPPDLGPDPAPHLRFNHVQAKGTHNSYHLRPDVVLHPSHDYSHAPLAVQLDEQGVRQLELDVHARNEGGFDVLHLPFIDPETTCLDLVECLAGVLAWSDAHPAHLPIVIWIEPKDEGVSGASGYVPNVDRLFELEDVIRSVLPRHRIVTPDDVRGASPTLPAALAERGWPSLHALRGRFLFALLDSGPARTAYLAPSPILEGRLMFARADGPEDPYAGMFKIDDGAGQRARDLIDRGFVVTSNVDSAERTPESNAASRAAALANGVHFLSSDRPAPQGPDDTDWLDIPGGTPARCNPVTAPADCTAAAIEDLRP